MTLLKISRTKKISIVEENKDVINNFGKSFYRIWIKLAKKRKRICKK